VSLPQIDNGIIEIAIKSTNTRTKEFGPNKKTEGTTRGMKLQAMQQQKEKLNKVEKKFLQE